MANHQSSSSPVVDLIVEREGVNSDLLAVLAAVVSFHHCGVRKEELSLGKCLIDGGRGTCEGQIIANMSGGRNQGYAKYGEYELLLPGKRDTSLRDRPPPPR